MDKAYYELLQDEKWKTLRQRIIRRDNFNCQKCQNSKIVNYEDDYVAKGIKATDGIVYLYFHGTYYPIKNMPLNIINLIPSSAFIVQFKIIKLSPEKYINIELVGMRKLDLVELEINEIWRDIELIGPINNQILKKHFKDNSKNIINKLGLVKFNEIINSQHLFSKRDYIKYLDSNWYYLFRLNVHHTFYQVGKMPWEYDVSSLITYCESCHREVHNEETIPYIDETNSLISNLSSCLKCDGTGYIHKYHYYMDGICFDCGGSGFPELKYINVEM